VTKEQESGTSQMPSQQQQQGGSGNGDSNGSMKMATTVAAVVAKTTVATAMTGDADINQLKQQWKKWQHVIFPKVI
jgi:hypothetical protein